MSATKTFQTFTEIVKASRRQIPRYAAVSIAETFDDFLYQIMRLARAVISMALFALMFYSLFFSVTSALLVLTSDGDKWVLTKYGPWFLEYTPVMIASFMLYVAIATPYRYKTTKPGLDMRTCGACGSKGPDRWHCGRCKKFRVAKVFTTAIWLLGLAVTLVSVVFDISQLLVNLFVFRKV